MQNITATEARFIKLGEGGKHEADAIEGAEPHIRLGFANPHHANCLAGDWKGLAEYWRAEGLRPASVTNNVRQIRDFYTLAETTVWITFFKRKLWYCFARPEVTELPCGDRIRTTVAGWRSTDIDGMPLYVDELPGTLSKVQGYRATLCGLKNDVFEVLLRIINAQPSPLVASCKKHQRALEESVVGLLRELNWKDFEQLVDLVFSGAGWRRVSALGKTEKSIDLDMRQPVSQKRIFVQIKSQADLNTFREYELEFGSMGQYDEFYFVYHSTNDSKLETYQPGGPVVVIGPFELAPLVVECGLVNWLILKIR